MADPPHSSPIHQKFITGNNPFLSLSDEFLRNHTKVLLRSENSDRTWKVKLNGGKLGGGWEDFAAVNNFRDGDVLTFRHDGDESFHVSVSSRSISNDINHTSPCYINTDGDDEEDNAESILVKKKKKKRQEAESSSGHSSCITACVTRYSLHEDRLDLSRDFNLVSFDDKDKKPHEIDLVNEKGRRWTLRLARNRSSGKFYIRQGWTNFCSANELSIGDFCKFKVVKSEERPVLSLCPRDSDNGQEDECPEVEAVKNCFVGGSNKEKSTVNEASRGKKKNASSPLLTINYSHSRYKSGTLSIPLEFIRKNGINTCGEVILFDKDGRKWSSYLRVTQCLTRGSRWFYLRRGWREMCKANGVEVNDSFMLELVWEDENPMFKFFSKIENKGKEIQRTRKRRACESVDKTPRVETEGHASKRRKRPSHQEDEKRGFASTSSRTNTHSRKPQCTQPNSCSLSDQLANAKKGIVETLKTVRQFRVELETREQNLEASLLEIDALGEMILGIGKIFHNTLVGSGN
ncbi:unnamed protein product [Cochlearia groenlandica]